MEKKTLQLTISPTGPSHPDQAERHAGETRPEVRGAPSLWPGRFPQHRPDSFAHAAGRLSVARERAYTRRPAAERT